MMTLSITVEKIKSVVHKTRTAEEQMKTKSY